ncbi:MAG TPA: protein kinase [Gaiellaceae bacterium]|nr:protein kinase [Gaiellaceae bacterium]
MQIDDVIADRYELIGLVGSGGMSTVYCARDRLLDRQVALKLLHDHYAADSEYVERFRREARSVARLSHPNIVTVIDRGEDGDKQFIVFEYVEGENLKQLIEDSGALELRRALEIAIDCADALAFAHANGLVHRDVKPQNVLIDVEGRIKVTDFGIARSLEVEVGVTQTGTVMGTSSYLSPEQARGRAVTASSDIYSLGVVLWELLTGEVPFDGDNFVAVALRHINEQPPSLIERRPDAPPRLATAVERALGKEPEDRFPTMAAFAEELRRCLEDLDRPTDAQDTLVGVPAAAPAAGPVPVTARARSRARTARGPILLVVVALVAVGAIVAGLLSLGGGGSGGRSPSSGSGSGAGGPVTLSAVGNYDPDGDPDSHADTASAATDGDSSTTWYTQIYATPQFGGLKHGLGLVVDAGGSTKLTQLTVQTPTPGFQAEVEAGDSASGPFSPDSSTQPVSGSTTFSLNGKEARYYVVWITQLPPGGKAEIAEVTAKR